MVDPVSVPTTKSNLMLYRKKLELVEKAYDLLKDKYDALLMKLQIIIAEVKNLREKMEKTLSESYIEYIKTESEIGRDMIDTFASTIPKNVQISSLPAEYMGVLYSDISIDNMPDMTYGFFGISSLLWITAKKFRETFRLLVELAKVEGLAYRLIDDIRSLQLNLNALDKVYKKRYSTIVRYIENSLEAEELDNIFIIKKIKIKKEQKKEQY